ncbi:MAG: hypothetical protein MSB10_02520 [Clostridiales bacterium]|uniref:hypothetical protein n=1 Tax=Flavonifractor porci TaxID=3133422 RepID=UPI003095DDCF|nr:hypothetical protein [Clostridiales bacterium]
MMDREERLREAMEREKANRIQQKRKRVFGSAQGLMACTFDKDNGAVPQLAWARQYVEHWPEMRRENMGLLFWGPAGAGKTLRPTPGNRCTRSSTAGICPGGPWW